jgi:malonyl-ACP O-methyltransferase BioC
LMASKETIKKTFGAAASTYADYSGFQRLVAEELAILVRGLADDVTALKTAIGGGGIARPARPASAVQEPGRVVDIGCGTGWLTSALSEAFPLSCVVGTDIAAPMVDLARATANGNEKEFIVSDCEALPFKEKAFDVAASNLTFQWVTDLGCAFIEAQRILAPNGFFCFSTLGPGTFLELGEALSDAGFPHPPAASRFADARRVESALREAGFTDVLVNKRNERVIYKDIFTLLRTLKNIGAAPGQNDTEGDNGLGQGSLLRKAGRIYAERFKTPDRQGAFATYELIIASARRPRGLQGQST